MANSMVRPSGDSLADFSRQPSNEIFQQCADPQMTRRFVKEEMSQTFSCTRVAWQEQEGQSGVNWGNDDKTAGSPLRCPSPEFLLKSPAESGEHCGANEMREEIPRKDDNNSTNSTTNDVITPITCIYCNKIFPTKNSLDVHVLALHDGKKVYDCSVCDKQFSHRSSRNIHLRVHTGQRPYECEICKKRFRVSSHLRDHVRTHTGERPFKCVLCGRGFKQSSDMKKHRKTHYKTSSINKNTHYNEDEPVQENSEHLPGNLPSDDQLSPEHHHKHLVDETANQIKVERKSSCERVISPLSCDSGVKVESDRSGSPENTTREKKIRYSEPLVQDSAAIDVATSARIRARYYGYSNLSNGLNLQEHIPTQSSIATFYHSVLRNNYQFQNTSDKNPDENSQQQMYGGYPLNTQYVENRVPHPVSMEMQNGEVTRDIGKRSRTNSDDGRSTMVPSNVYKKENSDVPTSTAQQDLGKRTEKDTTQEQSKTSGHTNTQDGIVPMDVGTAVTSEIIENLSENTVDGSGDAAKTTSNPGVVRKAVVVKLREEKGSDVRKNAMAAVKKPSKAVKKGRVKSTMQCATCMERFRSLEIFTAHTCDKNEKSFKCSVCGKMFARSTLLRQHMVLHQGTKRFKFKCNYCGRAFRHRSHLRDHERIHTGERPFKCNFCPKAFKQSSDLRKHENLHTGATRYCCEKCDVDFKRCDALKKHALLHPEGEVTVLKCEKCQSLFATADGHSAHVCHSKNRYRCQLCVQRYSSATALRQHCHQEHSDQSNTTCLKCEFCKLELQTLNELEVHLGTHQLQKSHKCNFCDKQYSLISQLEQHVKTHAKRTQDAVSETSMNLSPPDQPLTTKEFPVSNEAEQLYKENELNTTDNTQIPHAKKSGQNVTEGNAVTTQSVPVLSSSIEPVHQKYDFIPSSYQSLVHSTPMYGYIKNIVNTAKWYPPSNINEAGVHAIPPLIKSQATAQQDREKSGNRSDLADHSAAIARPNPTIDDKRATAKTEHGATAKQTTDAQERKVDEHFSRSSYQGSPRRMYDCLNCSKSFSQENLLTNHVCFIQSETFFHCLVCEKEFRYYEALLEHLRIHWKQVVYIRCNVCGERVRNEDRLKEHNLKHIEHDRKRRYMSEEPGTEKDVTSSWQSTVVEQQKRFPSEERTETGATLTPGSWAPTTITSLSTPVITSISGNNPFYSKAVNHGQPAINPHPRQRMAPEQYSAEVKSKVASPRTLQRSANETALVKVHSVNEKSIPRSGSQDPQTSYFETRKPVHGAFLNVFCQGSTMVVPAMQPLDASGRHPGGAGMVYPITMAYERRMPEQKNYEN